tara:strand:- start:1728 stop:2798 length:1071 start_codon:yes stop_codon:yes gene_type:complete
MGHKYVAFWFDGCWPKTDGIETKILNYISRIKKKDWITAVHPKYVDSLMLLNIDEFIAWPAKSPNFGNYKFWAENWVGECTVELSKTIERNIVVGAPQTDPTNFLNGLMGNKYTDHTIARGARVIIKRKNIPSSPIYFVNTEPSSPTVADAIKHTMFEQYVGATAGFKLLYYAYTYGIDIDNTKFVWYDFDAYSVKFKRHMVENWDGIDYTAFVKEWCAVNPEANIQLLKHVDKEWLNIVKQFGGMDSWLDFWMQVKLCNHEFLTVDLVNNYSEITDKLKNNASTFFWSSNIYSYVLLKVLSKPFTLERSFADLITRLQQINKCWFSGTDPNDNDLTCDVKWILGYSTNDSIGTGI